MVPELKRPYTDYFNTFERRIATRPRLGGPLVAWDLETTKIPERVGDSLGIELRYLTAFGKNFEVSVSVRDSVSLAAYWAEVFFTAKMRRARFVSWNGLRFDMLILFEAIANHAPQFVIRPYIGGGGAIRGAKVFHRDDPSLWWELLDGIAMTYVQRPLDDFLELFAPDHRKHLGAIDWAREEFDPRSIEHRQYAERDSEGLYHGMQQADAILRDLTGRGVQCTIGNAGIKFFEASIPEGIGIPPIPEEAWDAAFRFGLRGGYVYVARQHDGPLWQYDQNQAYAAAMRSAQLPAGRAIRTRRFLDDRPGMYWCEVSRTPCSPIPFLVRTGEGNFECFGQGVTETLLFSSEILTLQLHGWTINVNAGWAWPESFSMSEMVTNLERLRSSCAGGPKGAIGTMGKAIGNHSYGKSTERLASEAVVIANECPDGHLPWRPEIPGHDHFWCTVSRTPIRDRKRYHRPQIGIAITAHVRCALYSAIMRAPDAFLKADTDSIAFDRPVDFLDIDPVRYGAWKCEVDGSRGIVIGKKVYCTIEGGEFHPVCKGLSVRRLQLADYERWLATGEPPSQTMVQTLGWRSALLGNRYRIQERRGTDFRRTAPHLYGEIVA